MEYKIIFLLPYSKFRVVFLLIKCICSVDICVAGYASCKVWYVIMVNSKSFQIYSKLKHIKFIICNNSVDVLLLKWLRILRAQA